MANPNIEEFRIETNLEIKDLRALALYNDTRLRTIGLYLLVVITFIAIFVLSSKDYQRPWAAFLFLAVLPLILLRKYFMTLPGMFKNSEVLRNTISYKISEKGIENSFLGGTVFYNWNEIGNLAETRNHFLIFVHRSQALILPKKNISAEQIAAVKGFFTGAKK